MYRYKILLAEYKDQFILILPSPWHNSLSSLLKPTEEKVDIYFSSIVFIEHYLQKIQSFSSSQNEENHSLHADLQNENIEILSLSSIANAENEVIQIVNSTLYEAYIQKASDIHFENYAGGLHIRYRLDGILISIKKFKITP
jgi:Type II secretory pathway, ATPase PulE/Tfp pilus assembly pathway, ATPase PilB